ncbi:MAG: DUF1566 domain-containing protein [Candidatus Heimdallarchaeota archaeon]|nr:DUF1566 domain-containing protein [Candidatus Heimdallarchaeota archaeon]
MSYSIVDSNQLLFYDNSAIISTPSSDDPFYGQDAQYEGLQQNYQDNGDGTITDLNTGLMWEQGVREKMTLDQARDNVIDFDLGGYTDWRLPSIKELYSLMDFSGIDPSGWQGTDTGQLTPFINTEYFDFEYGDLSTERIIDAQYVSDTEYVGKTMAGDATVFGLNLADGRIKGYPIYDPMSQSDKAFFVKYVRGNSLYGENNFIDNNDGTISDLATGLMWMKTDSEEGFNWKEALEFAENLNAAGYDDWRLPNIKELQSIVEYSRSPQTTNSAAIDSIFEISTITDEGGSTNYPFFWSSTTHENMQNGEYAAYIAFGEALGFMKTPDGNTVLMDVHGAGAQRSDPKVGDPSDFPEGYGPQGDVIRIYNYVRAVRLQSSASENVDYFESSNQSQTPFYFSVCFLGIPVFLIRKNR